MNWEALMIEITTTLTPVIITIIGYLLIVIARFIYQHTDNILAKTALENLEKIIYSTVVSLSQTLVEELKKNRDNGKLTTEEASLVKNKALSIINSQITPKHRKVLEKCFCSVDNLVDNLIEQKVMELKLKKRHFSES